MKITQQWLSILEGCILVALGLHILNAEGLLISGTAGAGMILLRLTELSFGQLFFILNLPFYLLAWYALGRDFTIRTFLSISLLSGLSELMQYYAVVEMPPLLSAALGGLLVGFGLTILFRNNASLGGVNILSVYLEKTFGIHASKSMLAADICILIAAFAVLEFSELAYSLLAFVLLSSVVGRYHKPLKSAEPTKDDA